MNLSIAPDVSERIRDEIERAGKTQTTVMFAIDMPPSTWQRRMSSLGGSSWRIGDLDAIASVLDIDRSRLTG